jgi:hypothetical protein
MVDKNRNKFIITGKFTKPLFIKKTVNLEQIDSLNTFFLTKSLCLYCFGRTGICT